MLANSLGGNFRVNKTKQELRAFTWYHGESYICANCAFFLMLFLSSLDLEWKIIYVGSAESEEYDQVLDSVLVGPVPAGRHMFVFQVSSLFEVVLK